MRVSITTCLCCVACGSPSSSVAPAAPVGPQLAIRTTPRVAAAACALDGLERHPTVLSDLDGDGTLDRIALVRDAAGIAATLYRLPSFEVAGSWRLPDGDISVSTPRRRGSTRGNLWITAGAKVGAVWQETLYHLETGALAVSANARGIRIGVDVDGDGRVDPIGVFGDQVRALRADGSWLALPVVSPESVHGVPVVVAGVSSQSAQEEAFDLDGNGVPELVIEVTDGIEIVEMPAGRSIWKVTGKPLLPHLMRWGGEIVLAVSIDDQLRIYATDATHALIASYPDAPSFAQLLTAGDDIMMSPGFPSRFYERAQPTHVVGEVWQLVDRLDAAAPFGPVRLAPREAAGLVAVWNREGRFALQLIDPVTYAVRRNVWTSPSATGSAHEISASLVDLDRDGTDELLLDEVDHKYRHHGYTWNTSRMRILDGTGGLLWEEPKTRTDGWTDEGERKPKVPTEVDGTHVRAFNLGDGTMPLRIRSVRDEYYLLAASSTLQVIPACLE